MIGPWGPLGQGVENFLGWGYSLSWIGLLPFVFAWASPNVVRYLGERLAHVLMENYSNRPRGFYTVAHKIRKFILFWQFLEFTSLYLRNDKEYRHISSTKNKGGYLPCAAVPFILSYWRIFPQLSTGWVKASLVQFCNLNFFWQFLEFTSLYLRNDRESRHTMNTTNKGGFLPCATVPFIPAYLSWDFTRWAKT